MEPSSDATQDTPPTTPNAITLTAVHIGADGAPQITRRTLTAAQRAAFDPAAMTAARSAPHPAGGVSAHGIFVPDDPCAFSGVYLYDRFDFQGDVLCLTGTGTFTLSDYPHDWIPITIFGQTDWWPQGWQGKAASTFVTLSTADYYQDGAALPVASFGPFGGDNFIAFDDESGLFNRYPPDTVVIY